VIIVSTRDDLDSDLTKLRDVVIVLLAMFRSHLLASTSIPLLLSQQIANEIARIALNFQNKRMYRTAQLRMIF